MDVALSSKNVYKSFPLWKSTPLLMHRVMGHYMCNCSDSELLYYLQETYVMFLLVKSIPWLMDKQKYVSALLMKCCIIFMKYVSSFALWKNENIVKGLIYESLRTCLHCILRNCIAQKNCWCKCISQYVHSLFHYYTGILKQ